MKGVPWYLRDDREGSREERDRERVNGCFKFFFFFFFFFRIWFYEKREENGTNSAGVVYGCIYSQTKTLCRSSCPDLIWYCGLQRPWPLFFFFFFLSCFLYLPFFFYIFFFFELKNKVLSKIRHLNDYSNFI